MIISKRIKIGRAKVGSEQLLEHIQKYFNDTLEGEVLGLQSQGRAALLWLWTSRSRWTTQRKSGNYLLLP